MNYTKKYNMGRGWYNESDRHRLARLGIKTKITKEFSNSNFAKTKFDYSKKKPETQSEAYKRIYGKLRGKKINPLEAEFELSPKSQKFYRKLGTEYRKYWSSKISYAKLDHSLMSKLQTFLHKHISIKISKHPTHIQEHPDVIEARHDIENVTSWSKFNNWLVKHKKTLMYLGLGGLAGIIGYMAGVPTLMMNVNTGQIISVGGTLIGRTGIITQTVLTGMGVMEEVKVITKDTNKELYGDLQKEYEKSLISPEELKIVTPEQPAFIIKVKPKKNLSSSLSFNKYSKYFTDDENDYGDLSEVSSKPIPYSQLTDKERKVLYTSISKVSEIFKKWGKEVNLNSKNLQIVKRVGPDDTAFGAHQGDLIQIDRDILKNQDKTEGVLAHELIHKKFGVVDKTRELENLQIDFMGLAID